MLLSTFAFAAVGCATEGRVVTAHGYGVGSLMGSKQAELEARVAAGFLTSTVDFELETEGERRAIDMRPPAAEGEDLRITQVSDRVYRAELDQVVPAAVDERRRALGAPEIAEASVPRGPKPYNRARTAALMELITRANTCPDDVTLLVGAVDVVSMEIVEADGGERLRVAAHVSLEPCGTPSKMPKRKLPPGVRKAAEKARG